MKQPKTVRIEPGDVQLSISQRGTFTLTFSEWRDGAALKVAITLEDWWLEHLARMGGRVAAKRIADAATLKAAMESAFHAARPEE